MAVSEALDILHERGFEHCPQQVERIDSCAVTLTYIPGAALKHPANSWASHRRVLLKVTDFVKKFSVASAAIGSQVRHSDWLVPPPVPDGDVFVHGDPHPTNIIFDKLRRPRAIVDFELATLGTHDWNLISLIFCWGPLEPLEVTTWRTVRLEDVAARIQAILSRWESPTSPAGLVDTLEQFVQWRLSWIDCLARHNNSAALKFSADPNLTERYEHVLRTFRAAL